MRAHQVAMDALDLLALHIDWGADEALHAFPRDRLSAPAAEAPAPKPVAVTPLPAPAIVPAGSAVARAAALAAAAGSLGDLRTILAGFTDCPLQATAMHLVFADGNPGAALMLIGDCPGEAEDRGGRPFSGPGGQLLDRMLASIGLDRQSAYLTTAIPWRPPGNRKPTDHERALCRPFLHRHIALVRPRRLLLLGALATASLLPGGAASLRRLRGSWQPAAIEGLDGPLPALPSCSPEQLLATPAAKREAWADLLTLKRALLEDAAAAAR